MKLSNNRLLNITLIIVMLLATQQTSFAHWTTKGPYGGSVKTLLVVDSTLYVGTFDGGVFRSNNTQALSWRYANYDGLTSGHINALATAGGLIFAGTADAGVFVTSNFGNSWTSVNNGLGNLHILSMASSGSTLYVGTEGGVFITTDGGTSWTISNAGLTNQNVTALAVSGNLIFAGTSGGGVFFSLNSGVSWTPINTGLTNLNVKSIALAGTTAIVGTDNGVFSANTLNLTWSSAGLNNVIINSLAVSGTTIYAATSTGVFTSPTTLLAWASANEGYTGSVNAVVTFNEKLVAGTQEDGLIRSTSQSTINWKKANTGFNNLKTYALYNDGSLVIVATNKGLFVSHDLAANYTSSNLGLTDSLHITSLTFSGADLYVATQSSGVFMSADTGRTWTAVNDGLLNLSIQHIIGNHNHLVAAASNGQVFVAHVDEADWEWETVTGLPGGIAVTALATNGDVFFLGTDGTGVFSTDDPEDWITFSAGLTDQQVTSLTILNNYVYAGTAGSGVFKSNLASAAWAAVNTGLPTLNIVSLAAAGQNVVAGYKGGVYTSYNEGDTWVAPNILQFLPQYADVKAISFSGASSRIFVSTPDNSAYSNGISELPTSVSDLVKNGGSLLLSPNPSRGQFQMELKNVDANISEVTVYDQMGRLVKRLEYDHKSQLLSMSVNCPPGVYTVCAITNKGIVTQKLIIE